MKKLSELVISEKWDKTINPQNIDKHDDESVETSKNDATKPDKVLEADQGEVDNGMYAGNGQSMAFGKNTPEKAPVMESSVVRKKIRYKVTPEQNKMIKEIRTIQENIRKIAGNKKLLY